MEWHVSELPDVVGNWGEGESQSRGEVGCEMEEGTTAWHGGWGRSRPWVSRQPPGIRYLRNCY